MQPKKHRKADLEGKRGLFFLVGIALALIAAITIIQYETALLKPAPTPKAPIADIGDAIPITKHKVKKEKVEKIEKINKKLPPKEVDDKTKLNFDSIFSKTPDPFEGDKPVEIGMEPEAPAEPIPYFRIEKIARPVECEKYNNREEQKTCFDEWMRQFIRSNTNYPRLAREMNLQDKVFVEFIISENGQVESVSVIKGEYDILNKEAARVLSSLPEMVPGSQQGRTVKMRMTVPVNFKLGN